ncbi:hypothetical protein [Mogibacterium sp. CM50]|jgi:hypothetical protein|uniref:hypothetical protein n=1 Tax=Mogibacterium sp. CM50 TaxID=936375 RepID=UPI00027C35DD|nr:hypothetical protein [Mogibacterium sp. CM50]EJU21613.1 hypothetical protein HMPREF1152_0674 [Mogibacterium sp. CM50]
MVDIGIKLKEMIDESFSEYIAVDMIIRGLNRRIEKNIATQKDVITLCKRLGDIGVRALQDNIKPDILPNGKMYWNIAEKAIKPLMINIHTIVNQAAAEVLETEHQNAGIHIKTIISPFPEERIESLINNFVEAYNAGTEEDE